jgi:PAS domain S-box-containing protein
MKKTSTPVRPSKANVVVDGQSQNQDKYRYNLIDQINDLVCEIDEDGKLIYINRKFKEVLGYEPWEALGRFFYEFVHPDEFTRIIEEFKKNLSSSSEIIDTYRFKHKDGQYLTVESKGTVYFDEQTNSKRIVSVSRDLTDKIRAEELRLASERKYRTLHESMMDGFVYVSLEGKILEFNSVYQQMLGYDPEELCVLTYQELTPLEWHEFEKDIVDNQILKLGYSDVYEKEYIRKDGIIFPVELRAFLIRDIAGQPDGIWGIARDITERKNSELNLRKLNQQLADLNTTKDKLLSIIAHDLRAPFNSILGYVDLLKDEIRQENYQTISDYTSRINTSARQSYYLLENLLAWANMQTGSFEVFLRKVNLKSAVEQLIRIFEASATAKQIRIILQDNLDIMIMADIQMLRAILRNLIFNAIKFTGIAGEIKIYSKDSPLETEIVVEDNGIGMTKARQMQLFRKPDFNGSRGTANEAGSGLGLLICKEFVEQHSGRIWVESKPNKGSKFHFTIPKLTTKIE